MENGENQELQEMKTNKLVQVRRENFTGVLNKIVIFESTSKNNNLDGKGERRKGGEDKRSQNDCKHLKNNRNHK